MVPTRATFFAIRKCGAARECVTIEKISVLGFQTSSGEITGLDTRNPAFDASTLEDSLNEHNC